jgi:hypothetical protein
MAKSSDFISAYGSGIGALRLLDLPADTAQPLAQHVAAVLVDRIHLGRIVAALVERDDRGDLDRLERAVVEVRLEAGERSDDLAVADHEGGAPAGHRP